MHHAVRSLRSGSAGRATRLRAVGVAGALITATALAGCAGEAGPGATNSAEAPPTQTAAGFPVTVDTSTGPVRIEKQPQRIVSLSPSATETLFAIGAGSQVIAADEYSTYPADAPKTTLSGFEPNVEAIAGYEPDLLVVAMDMNDLVGSMTKLGVPVIVSPAPLTVDAGYGDMAALGTATGHTAEAEKVIATMRDDVATALAKAPNEPIRVYHELDSSYHSASSHSFIGSIYKDMGATNIADAADTDKTGYPALTEEAVVAADPQLIVITDQSGYGVEDVLARPGWSQVSAVKNKAVMAVDADVASRWGPRLPQFITTVADAMSRATSALSTPSASAA